MYKNQWCVCRGVSSRGAQGVNAPSKYAPDEKSSYGGHRWQMSKIIKYSVPLLSVMPQEGQIFFKGTEYFFNPVGCDFAFDANICNPTSPLKMESVFDEKKCWTRLCVCVCDFHA